MLYACFESVPVPIHITTYSCIYISYMYISLRKHNTEVSCRDVTSNWKPIWIFSTTAGNVLQRNGYLHWTLNQTFVFTLTYSANKSLCVYERRFLGFWRKITFFFFDLVSEYTALKAGVSHPFLLLLLYIHFFCHDNYSPLRQTVLFNKLCRS